MKNMLTIACALSILLSTSCNEMQRKDDQQWKEDNMASYSEQNKFLWPENNCPANKIIDCLDEQSTFVRADDRRCGCLHETDYVAINDDPHKCTQTASCVGSYAEETSRWTKLSIGEEIVGCGCFVTVRGKISPVEGFPQLYSRENVLCKSAESSKCYKPGRIFVRADDGRCGCVKIDYLETDINKCIVQAQDLSRIITQVPWEHAKLYQGTTFVGCGQFVTNL
jgi:hypothetical protein